VRSQPREGAAADLLLIERDRLAAGRSHPISDFPANSERYVVEAEGYRAVVVNGEVLLEEGKHTGALPGTVLRLD
jgi:N-acyl-D-aspartate/D-glutamate deacylase